ncbi:hypothetical protein BOX15_Mlig032631g1, partial [Macrostomum lignano]
SPSEFRFHCNNWPLCLSGCPADAKAIVKAMEDYKAFLGYKVFTVTYILCDTQPLAPLKQCVENAPYESYRASLKLSMYINASGPPVVLSLTKADFIAPRGSFQLRYKEGDQQAVSDKFSRCFYEGKIQGDPQSSAFVDVCSDRVHGIFRYQGADFTIQPIECNLCQVYKPHAVLPVVQHQKSPDAIDRPIVRDPAVKTFFAAFTELLQPSVGGQPASALLDRVVASGWPPAAPPAKEFVVKLAVVIDYSLYSSLGRSQGAASSLAGRVVGQANRLLTNSRVALRLQSLELLDSAGLPPLNGSLRAGLLAALDRARLRRLPAEQALLLLTGANYSTRSEHLSMMDSVCTGRAASIVRVAGGGSTEWPRTARLAGLAVAEQLGMLAFPCLTGSDCSPDRLLTRSDAQRLEAALQAGTADCLLNGAAAPSSDLRLCGNGRLDRSEECDASSAGPACCNATTCMLHSWATCRAGSGACCSGCRLRPAGSICRASTNNCDLPELCNGTDEACPDDSKLADWQPCAGQSGGGDQLRWCLSGQCAPTREASCQKVWGASASAGPLECYEGIKLDPCATLMCVGGQGKPVHELKVQWPNSTELKCRYKSMDIALPDGSSCPSGTACLSGRCLQPAELAGRVAASVACPRDSQTHLVCSGRGVCTTRAACLCRPGWTGRSCERRLGPNDRVNLLQQLYWSPAQGSRDSNPTDKDKGNGDWTILICALVGFFLLLLVVTSAYICRKKLCRTGHQNFSNSSRGAGGGGGIGGGGSGIGGGSGKGRQKNDLGYEVRESPRGTTVSFAPPSHSVGGGGSSGGSLNSGCQINRLNSAARLQQQQSDTCSQTLPDKGILRNKEVGELQEMSNLLDSHLGRQSGSASSMEYDECETRGSKLSQPAKLVPPVLLCDSSMQTDKTPKHQQQQLGSQSIEYLPESDRYKNGSNGSGASYSNANVYSSLYAPVSVGSSVAGGSVGGKLAANPINFLAETAHKPDYTIDVPAAGSYRSSSRRAIH